MRIQKTISCIIFLTSIFLSGCAEKKAPSKNLHQVWWNERYGEVDLRTFDGGKVWYACEKSSGDSVKIIGVADKVYPGIMDSLKAHAGKERERREKRNRQKESDDALDISIITILMSASN